MSETRRIAFTRPVTPSAFAELATSFAWRLVGAKPASPVSDETVWNVEALGAQVTFVDDHLMGLQYLVVSGTPDAILGVVLAVDHSFPICTRETVGALLSPISEPGERIVGIYVAALLATPAAADTEILNWFRQTINDPDATVRRAAYFAATYLGWRELEPILGEAARADQDAEAREMAEKALASLERNVWNKP